MSDDQNQTQMERPGSLSELGCRLSAVLDQLGTRRKAAEIAGRSTDMLSKYERGAVEPPFTALARVCLAANVSLEWLATGIGEIRNNPWQPARNNDSQSERLDLANLEAAVSAVEAGLGVLDVQLDAGERARLIAAVYRRLAERELSPAEVVTAVLQSIKSALNRG